jgi:hypothetical protein
MQYKMKYFVKELDERVVGLASMSLTEMQADGLCDSCNKPIAKGTRVIGKIVNLQKGLFLVGSRFSPTCMQCADIN